MPDLPSKAERIAALDVHLAGLEPRASHPAVKQKLGDLA